MLGAVRFLVALVLGLALVTWIASVMVQRTTRAWFERDLSLRAELAVRGARQGLASHWDKELRSELRSLLAEITRDERIMGAAACSSDLALLARTRDFPDQLSCEELGRQVRPPDDAPGAGWTSWKAVRALPGGKVHVSAILKRLNVRTRAQAVATLARRGISVETLAARR